MLSSSILVEEGTMRVQLTQQAQALLGQSDLVMITERVDDVALLIGQMVEIKSLDRATKLKLLPIRQQ
jgi:hypothetical protein